MALRAEPLAPGHEALHTRADGNEGPSHGKTLARATLRLGYLRATLKKVTVTGYQDSEPEKFCQWVA